MIDLAHRLGLSVVAEGVENQAAMDLLIEYGCDSAQGYLLGRPAEADALARCLTESLPSPRLEAPFGPFDIIHLTGGVTYGDEGISSGARPWCEQ